MAEHTLSRLWRWLQEPPVWAAAPILGAFIAGLCFGVALCAEYTR